MISALLLVAGIHSTTNLKTYKQKKNLFSLGNTQSSSGESPQVLSHICPSYETLHKCDAT